MAKYKLTIAYDGTAYSGWQIQPNAQSIQEIISHPLSILSKVEKVNLVGSGRTDAGVHALGQTAHFIYPGEIPQSKWLHALNCLLPKDIRILAIESVPDEFHARYTAVSKEYHYHLYLDRTMDPFRRHYCWQPHARVDLTLLMKASQLFVGTHDFSSFSNEAHRGSAARDPIRHLMRLDCCPIPGGVRLEFEGNGFLYKMVRNIVGTLVEVASGKMEVDRIPEILAAKDRREAGMAAPPQGLFLVKVNY